MAAPTQDPAAPRTRCPRFEPSQEGIRCRSRRRSRRAPRSGCTASSSSRARSASSGGSGSARAIAGHITVRDPEDPHMFWVNPFGMSFRHIRVSDLIAVEPRRRHRARDQAGEPGRLRHPLRGPPRPPGGRRRRARALGVRQGVVVAGPPARPDHPGRLHALREPRRRHRGPRRRRARPRGRARARDGSDRPQDGLPPESRDLRRRARRWPRPRGGSSTPSATARPSCWPRPPGRRRRSTTRTRSSSAEQTGTAYAGWFSFQPLWDEVVRTDPDLFD